VGCRLFVVLDEPNSNLDGQGEAALKGALEVLRANQATVVVIGHRSSTLDLVDMVLVLEHGNVRTFGTVEQVRNEMGIGQVRAV